MTNPTLLLTALLVGQAPDKIQAPADAWVAAERDLVKLPETQRLLVRYLTFYDRPLKERQDLHGVYSGHVNQLSTEPDLIQMAPVPGSDGSLFRINMEDYGWTKSLWEQLAEADPWFHVKLTVQEVVVPWEGGVWPEDGKFYAAGSFTVKRKRQTTAIAPDIAPKQTVAAVVAMTGSTVPVVRGDWFLALTVTQNKGRPGYYTMLGVKNQKGFEKLVRFDADLGRKLEHRRIVVFSGIVNSGVVRRVERKATVLGGLWATSDSEDAVGNKNPLRELDDVNYEFDATEQIAPLINGMPAYLLANNKGVLQNEAPNNVVGGDRLGGGNDTRLRIGISCIRCHFGPKENGVKDLDSIRIGKLKSVDYKKFQELRRLYLRDVAPLVANDRNLYATAIKQVTGLEATEWAQGVQREFSRYEDARIDAVRAAAEIGVGRDALIKAFQGYDLATDNLDPVLSVIMNGGAVPQRQWEEAYHTARQVMFSVK